MTARERYEHLAQCLHRAEMRGSTTGVLIYSVLLLRHLQRSIRKGLLYWHHSAM